MAVAEKRKSLYTPKHIRDIRGNAGLTLAKAAEKVGVTRRAWSQYEAGERIPSRCVEILIGLMKSGKL